MEALDGLKLARLENTYINVMALTDVWGAQNTVSMLDLVQQDPRAHVSTLTSQSCLTKNSPMSAGCSSI